MEVTICTDLVVWDKFIQQSPLGCPSLLTSWLQYHDLNAQYLMVRHKNRFIAACPLTTNIELIKTRLLGYFGIVLSNYVLELPVHSRVKVVLNIIDVLLKNINSTNNDSILIFNPDFEDMRGVLWYNYHGSHKGKYEIKIFYTTILKLENKNENIKFVEQYNTLNELDIICSIDDIYLNELFDEKNEKNILCKYSKEAIKNTLKLNNGEVIYYRNDRNKMCVILYDKESAQLIFNKNIFGKDECAIINIIYKAINQCIKKQVYKLDLNYSSYNLTAVFNNYFECIIRPYYEATLIK